MSRHGTLSTYTQGCHCPPCRAANAAYHREWRARQRIIPLHVRHGDHITYATYGCRCGPCTDAQRVYMREYRRRRRQEATR